MMMGRSLLSSVALPVLAVVALACARVPAPDPASTLPSGAASSSPASAQAPASASEAGALAAAGSATRPDPAGPPAPADAQPEPPMEGKDFLPEALTIFRVAACGSTGEVPARFDQSVVDRHCEALARAYDDYKRSWIDVAKPFLGSLRPRDLPGAVVYPFGGGDLVSALATFPDATEITTISLEPAGDVRPIDSLAPERLAHELSGHRDHLVRLFAKAHSRTDNLEKESKTDLPGEILFDLAALVVHGDEPLSLRYFRLRPDGSVAYVTQADIDEAKRGAARRALFANAELRFRRAGSASGGGAGPTQVLRHLSFNLDDAHLKQDPSLLAHLNNKGKVAAMTKAATHLLWDDHFSSIRSWLVDHTDWMVSDSTGIPPRIAGPAGFVQDTYGTFDGPSPFGLPDAKDARDLKRLFASQPSRDLAFRYGYPDKDGHAHMVVTRRAPPP
jgi:hypothetical protein